MSAVPSAGAACVISSRYVETKAHDYADMRPLTQKLVIAFQKRMGSRLCAANQTGIS